MEMRVKERLKRKKDVWEIQIYICNYFLILYFLYIPRKRLSLWVGLQNYTYLIGEGRLLSVSSCIEMVESTPPGGHEVAEPDDEDGLIYTARMVVKVTGGWSVPYYF